MLNFFSRSSFGCSSSDFDLDHSNNKIVKELRFLATGLSRENDTERLRPLIKEFVALCVENDIEVLDDYPAQRLGSSNVGAHIESTKAVIIDFENDPQMGTGALKEARVACWKILSRLGDAEASLTLAKYHDAQDSGSETVTKYTMLAKAQAERVADPNHHVLYALGKFCQEHPKALIKEAVECHVAAAHSTEYEGKANYELAKLYHAQWGKGNASQLASEKVIASGDKGAMLEHAEWCLTRSTLYVSTAEETLAKETFSSLGNTLKWEDLAGCPKLKKLYRTLPHLKVPLYSDSHYSFFSTDTHAISGMVGLTSVASAYVHKEYVDGVCGAMYQANNGLSKAQYARQYEAMYGESYDSIVDQPFKLTTLGGVPIDQGNRTIEDVISGIFPPGHASKNEVIAFYAINRSLEFSMNGRAYEIKPVLLHDIAHDRYYLHIELGKKEELTARPASEQKHMLNFCGNGITHGQQIETAGKLLALTGVKQIVPMYANKGINSLLNPDLTAPTTSVKGSVNPHLLAYNHLEQGTKLEIYAHSYGNLASAQFIHTVKEIEPEKTIFFIGSATAASLFQAARGFVGSVADIGTLLLERSDVSEALSQPGITSIIFNDKNDKVIKESAQLQTHVGNLKASDEHGGILQGANMTIKLVEGDPDRQNHYDCVSKWDTTHFRDIYNSLNPSQAQLEDI